ncbi:MAG: hypothetical protein KIT79_13510 [Deltaproteobacteria bacterium]|nr:hypothetical protein [Deltaproteobacteria bacterium]
MKLDAINSDSSRDGHDEISVKGGLKVYQRGGVTFSRKTGPVIKKEISSLASPQDNHQRFEAWKAQFAGKYAVVRVELRKTVDMQSQDFDVLIYRAIDKMPRPGKHGPWKLTHDYYRDIPMLRDRGPVSGVLAGEVPNIMQSYIA